MASLSQSEENYLKEIFHLTQLQKEKVSTNSLASRLNTKASSITDMLQKLAEKQLVQYIKYKGCSLTENGEKIAVQIIRKHRLWETFLVNKLNFGWDEVHEVAEELEHIDSVKLVDSLDQFLNYPKFDPHGDPIPDKNGKIPYRKTKMKLVDAGIHKKLEIVRVNEDEMGLLKYLERQNLQLGTKLEIIEKFSFDDSMLVRTELDTTINLSKKVTENISVKIVEN
ncbi:metal-dependent transcriptional regulator [Crocinitomix algicola]|uniref:metal-dependent transcriptional regulator n=1 Tax=Crocinitomix algicola TaxID=1740263 RepID=UPI000ACF0402|nr:metal-dependent transcriptional regulator [Crocinitomix algicola]